MLDLKEKCLWHNKAVEAENCEFKCSAEVRQIQNWTNYPENPSKYSSTHALYGRLWATDKAVLFLLQYAVCQRSENNRECLLCTQYSEV